MSRTIVCGVDEDQPQAPELAAQLAASLGSDLHLVHAVDARLRFVLGADAAKRAGHAAVSRAERLLHRAAATALHECGEGRLERPSTEAVIARPVEGLSSVAASRDAELLVVGARRRSTVNASVLGSVSRELVMAPPCPVVVAPAVEQAPSPEAADAVVCGVDDSPASRHAVAVARDLAARLKLRLVLAHVSPPAALTHGPGAASGRGASSVYDERNLAGDSGVAVLDRAAQVAGDAVETRLVQGHVEHQLRAIAAHERAFLIVVGMRRRGVIRTALASVPLHLAGSSGAPVAVVPEPRESAPRGSTQLNGDMPA